MSDKLQDAGREGVDGGMRMKEEVGRWAVRQRVRAEKTTQSRKRRRLGCSGGGRSKTLECQTQVVAEERSDGRVGRKRERGDLQKD